jgi:hypothetical protein
MNLDTIYVVITTHLSIHRRLDQMFTEALVTPHKLVLESGALPGLARCTDDSYNRDKMRFIFSEHMSRFPLMMEPNHPEPAARIQPAICDTPNPFEVHVAVIGRIHSGKTAIIRELENTLIADGIPREHITRQSLDYTSTDPEWSAKQQAECLANMATRKVVILFQHPRRFTDPNELFTRCAYPKRLSQRS